MKITSELAFKIISLIPNLAAKDVVSLAIEIHNGAQSPQPLCEVPILEEIAMAIRKRNGFPMLDFSTEKLRQRFFAEIAPEQMQLQPVHYYHLIDHIKAFIEIGWKHITPYFSPELKKQKNVFQYSGETIWEKIIAQDKKIIFLNYPTPELAAKIDQNYEQLLRQYIKLLDCNYEHIQSKCESLLQQYSGKQLTIFSQENKLDAEIPAQKAAAYDGSLESTAYIILPTGKVEFELNRSQLNGLFEAEKCYYQDVFYDHVSIQFENGDIRFVNFSEEKKGNFLLQNALMNSKRQCYMSLGVNLGSRTLTNYYAYDRCIDGNFSLKLLDTNGEPILLSNRNAIIRKI